MNNLISGFLKLKEKGFFHLLVSNYSVQFIVFTSHLLIAKIMLPEDVGIVKTIETFASIAIVLGSGGVLFAILKIIPENTDASTRRFILSYAIKVVFLTSFIVFLVFNLLAFFEVISNDPDTTYWFHTYSLLFIPSVIIQLLTRYYQAIEKFKRISSLIFVFKLFSAFIVLSFTFYFFIKGYIISMVVTTVIIGLALLFDLRNSILSPEFNAAFQPFRAKINKLSKEAFLAQVIDQFKLHSGFMLANYLLLDRIDFGYYAFALIIIQGLNILASSVQQFVTPKMSKISHDSSNFFKTLGFFEKKYILITSFIFILAQLVISSVILLVFGETYEPSILFIRIMLVGWYINGFFALKGIVFLSLGRMKIISLASFLILILSVPIMYYLNIEYNGLGAAISYVVQSCISLVVITYFTHKTRNKMSIQ